MTARRGVPTCPRSGDGRPASRAIRLLSLDGSRGPAVAKQAALEEASGEFVAFVSDMALLHPSALGIVARHLNVDPGLNLVYSNEGRIDAATGRDRPH